jgi:hypothetical protein
MISSTLAKFAVRVIAAALPEGDAPWAIKLPYDAATINRIKTNRQIAVQLFT